MTFDLERPAKVRRIFEAITAPDRVAAIGELYGEDAPVVLAALTGAINNAEKPPTWTQWDAASLLYDAFGGGT